MIKGTIHCVSHHDKAVTYDVPEQGQVIADVRVLTNIGDGCHTPLYPSPGIMNSDFRGEFYHLERGDSMAKGRVSIVVERCKACGFCVEFCPSHVLALSSAFNSKGYHPPHVVHPEKCSGCDLCGMYCPDFAICATKVDLPKKVESTKEGDK